MIEYKIQIFGYTELSTDAQQNARNHLIAQVIPKLEKLCGNGGELDDPSSELHDMLVALDRGPFRGDGTPIPSDIYEIIAEQSS